MKRVVERCPTCGVEHDDDGVHACEACDTPLRHWCRVHSREIGWLDGPVCLRCDPEAADRPRAVAYAPPPPPASPFSVTAPPLERTAADAAATYEGAAALLRKRLKEAEEREKRLGEASPVPEPPVAAPPSPAIHTEPAKPRAEPPKKHAAEAPGRSGLGLRLWDGLMTMMETTIAFVLAGMLGGGGWAFFAGQDVPYAVGYYGALLGFGGAVVGAVRAGRVVFGQSSRRRR